MRVLKCDRCKCTVEFESQFAHIAFTPIPAFCTTSVSNASKTFEVCKDCHILMFREITDHAKAMASA